VQTANGLTGANTKPALGSDANGTGGFSGLIVCSANLPDKIAIATDTQMDDGNILTGTLRGQLQSSPNPNVNVDNSATAAYAETGTNTYMLCRAF
jgi:hypothetical protein